ncbi:MAG: GspE/PulE family protein, partial [Bdellovibrionota bacterium]
MDQELATPILLRILTEGQLLAPDMARDILSKEADIRRAIEKERSGQVQRLGLEGPAAKVSAIEVVAYLRLRTGNENGGKLLTEERIAELVANRYNLRYLKINPLELKADFVTGQFPKRYAYRQMIVPIREEGGKILTAIPDPLLARVVGELSTQLGKPFEPVLATKTDILKVITEFYGLSSSLDKASEEFSAIKSDLNNLENMVELRQGAEIESDNAVIRRLVDYLFTYALDQKASDIHLEPKRSKGLVRLRIDGVLHTVLEMRREIHNAVISHLKTRSRLDIAEKRRPQDGRHKLSYYGQEVEMRLSTLPVAFGEKLVIRIFNPEILIQDIESLGFFPREQKLFEQWINTPNGLILVTGPTGSGKTTTLYSALNIVSTPDVSVTTIEDPIEMVVEKFNQTAVHNKIGVTFGAALRTILRQDPDIIMVGEIRDTETAQNAIQAALTGHLVLSTLHTNDAPTAVTRLLELGIEPYLVASTLLGVVAQRLVRKICPDCEETVMLTEEQMELLKIPTKTKKELPVKKGAGCASCRGTGYKGREGIYECLEIT